MNKASDKIKEEVFKIIKENPGIRGGKITKKLPPEIEVDFHQLSEALYDLLREGKIVKVDKECFKFKAK